MTRSAEARLDAARSALFEPVIRLGVTGLARAGKTVFITSLVSNLTDRGRMPGLRAEAGGRIEAVWLRPQPDMTVPRFDYETHRAALTADDPHWPGSTRSVSELRLSFRLRPGGLRGLTGARRLHLDIVDYPGEWLLDLGLMGRSYRDWAEETLARIGAMAGDAAAGAFLAAARETDPAAPLDEP
ncbi:MAG: YcjX family protein, partial [Gemmobacter sp.]